MQAHSLEFYFGAKDWQHDNWLDSFYPDDLPEDWQFSYYNNEFQCVLLSDERLQNIDEEQLQEWLEDIAEPFRFFVELCPHTQWRTLEPKLRTLAPYVGGVILHSTSPLQEAELERFEQLLVQWYQWCAELSLVDTTVVMDAPELSPGLKEWLLDHGINTCWRAQTNTALWQGGTMLVAMVEQQGVVAPAMLGQWLQDILAFARQGLKGDGAAASAKAGGIETVVVLFVGAEPDADSIKKADMIAQMLQ